jgi:hypothetical protein
MERWRLGIEWVHNIFGINGVLVMAKIYGKNIVTRGINCEIFY